MKKVIYLFFSIFVSLILSCSDNKVYHKKDTVEFKEISLRQPPIDTVFYSSSFIPDSEFVIPCKIKDSRNIGATINHFSFISNLSFLQKDEIYAHINYDKDIYIEYNSNNMNLDIGRGPIIIIIRKSLRKACFIHCAEFTPFGKTYGQFYTSTPFVSTTLKQGTINNILPNFSGKYRNIVIDSLMLDYNDKYFSIRDYFEYRNKLYESSQQEKFCEKLFYKTIRIYSQYRFDPSESNQGPSIIIE